MISIEWTTKNIILAITFGVLVIVLLMLFISAVVIILKKNSRKKFKNSENTRIFIVDMNKKTVKKFDKTDLRDIVEISLGHFYDQFDDSSRYTVVSWLNSFIEKPAETRSFLEAKIHLSRSNKSALVLLEMTSINQKKKIIHLTSQLLPHLSDVTSKHNGKHYLIDFETMQAKYQQAVKNNKKRGVGCLIKIYSKHDILVNSTKFNLGATTIQLTNILTPYLKETRFLVSTDVNEMFIFDTTISTRSLFFSLANEIVRGIERYLIVNSLDDEFGVVLGAALFDPTLKDIKIFISKCREMSQLAEREDDMKVALYEENSNKISNSTSLLYNELSSIVHNRSFRYYFTPILSALDAEVLYYDTKIIPYGSSLSTLEEVIDVAQDVHLIAPVDEIIMNDILKPVKNSERVLLRVSLSQLKEIVTRIEDAKDKTFILALDQLSLSLFDDESTDFLSLLEKARNVGFSLALAFNGVPTSPLDEDILRMFSAFILEESMTKGINTNERVRTDVRLMLATYSTYDKPIVVLGLKAISDLEVSLALGVKFFTCSAFANASSTLEVLEEKKRDRLIELNKRLN